MPTTSTARIAKDSPFCEAYAAMNKKKAEAARANRTRTRLASGEKANAKRMAEVAAVYTLKQWPRSIEDVLHGLRSKETEARRPRPTSKRVWARAPNGWQCS
jgi:hypothetical protein